MCLLTEQQAAEKSSVSRDTIRRLVKAGRIRWVNLGTGTQRAVVRIPCEALAEIAPPAKPETPEPAQPPRRRRRRLSAGEPVW